jgi:hypothetical protein
MAGVTAAEAVLARTAGTPIPRAVIAAAAIRVFSDLMRFPQAHEEPTERAAGGGLSTFMISRTLISINLINTAD